MPFDAAPFLPQAPNNVPFESSNLFLDTLGVENPTLVQAQQAQNGDACVIDDAPAVVFARFFETTRKRVNGQIVFVQTEFSRWLSLSFPDDLGRRFIQENVRATLQLP